jgi:hypothetical protein
MSNEHIIIVAGRVGMAEFERQIDTYLEAFRAGALIDGKRVIRFDIRRSSEKNSKPIDAEIWLEDE